MNVNDTTHTIRLNTGVEAELDDDGYAAVDELGNAIFIADWRDALDSCSKDFEDRDLSLPPTTKARGET